MGEKFADLPPNGQLEGGFAIPIFLLQHEVNHVEGRSAIDARGGRTRTRCCSCSC